MAPLSVEVAAKVKQKLASAENRVIRLIGKIRKGDAKCQDYIEKETQKKWGCRRVRWSMWVIKGQKK